MLPDIKAMRTLDFVRDHVVRYGFGGDEGAWWLLVAMLDYMSSWY
jgi:hypothetical protein